MKAENNLIAFIIAIRDFLEGIKDVHIESFLADWPSANCITRSVLPYHWLHSISGVGITWPRNQLLNKNS